MNAGYLVFLLSALPPLESLKEPQGPFLSAEPPIALRLGFFFSLPFLPYAPSMSPAPSPASTHTRTKIWLDCDPGRRVFSCDFSCHFALITIVSTGMML